MEAGSNASVGSVGDSYDNAMAESIGTLYKAGIFIKTALAADWTMLSERLSLGLIGSTTNEYSLPLVTCRQLSMNYCIIKALSYKKRRDSNNTVSDEPWRKHLIFDLPTLHGRGVPSYVDIDPQPENGLYLVSTLN